MCSPDDITKFWKNDCEESYVNFERLKRLDFNFTPFIGSGMSVPFGFTTWYGFLKEVIDSLPDDEQEPFIVSLEKNEYTGLAENLDKYFNNAIEEKIRNKFSPEKMEKSVNNYLTLLKKMNIKNFITTNFDSVIESQYNGDLKVISPFSFNKFNNFQREGIPYILKLDCNDGIIFTKSQFDKHYSDKNSDFIKVLNYALMSKVSLFIGCSLLPDNDPLMKAIEHLVEDKNNWNYAILAMPTTANEKKLRERDLIRLKIRPIWYPYGKHDSVYTILSMLHGTGIDLPPGIEHSENEFSNNFSRYIDPLAKDAFDKTKADTLCKAILTQTACTDARKMDLKEFCKKIDESTEKYPFEVQGEPGTGKSTLLSMLYLHKLHNSAGSFLALIDLHYYDDETPKNALIDLENQLILIDKVVKRNKNILLFIDGLNRFKKPSDKLQQKIHQKISDWNSYENIRYVRATGIIPRNESPLFFAVENIDNFMNQSKYIVVLNPINVHGEDSSSLLNNLIMSCQVCSNPMTLDSLSNNLKASCAKAVDDWVEFRTATFLIKNYSAHGEEMFLNPIGSIYHNYYSGTMGPEKLIETAEYVAKYMLKKNHVLQYPSASSIIYKSSSIRNFMFAYYYVHTIKNDLIEKHKIFDCILTPCINHFAVDLITQEPVAETKIINNVIANYNNFTLRQQNQWAYFLGRTKSCNAKHNAVKFLKKIYQNMADDIKAVREDKNLVLNMRSIGISLIYCGDYELEDDFYRRLIYDSKFREINRNFHLEYYTTIQYKVSDDDIKIDNTDAYTLHNIERLYNILHHNINFEKNRHTYFINIITLIHLVVFSYYQKKVLPSEIIFNGFENLLEELQRDSSITNKTVKDYIVETTDHIREQNIYSAVFEKIYKMKNTVRTGWTKVGREINKKERPESIADHTWACCQLAQMLLPDRIDDCNFIGNNMVIKDKKDYDKKHIIMLLLFHDLPEVETGDIVSDQKTRNDSDHERIFIDSLKVLDSFDFFSSFHNTAELFGEYAKRNTINAEIAHDIDKLEPLVQLYIYRKLLPPENAESEKNQWIRDVNRKLKTEIGLNLLDFIKKHLLGKDFQM